MTGIASALASVGVQIVPSNALADDPEDRLVYAELANRILSDAETAIEKKRYWEKEITFSQFQAWVHQRIENAWVAFKANQRAVAT